MRICLNRSFFHFKLIILFYVEIKKLGYRIRKYFLPAKVSEFYILS
ncbi:hypothetical protein HOLDEFILI_03467 [Holdemania filiformis DSM 12042]|uniref:Uncharacterized protein n=1 Tax=Holdemania filiformis DSM 12042 TaxID=545696 RepID=B9YCA8_9FIRM|nr:hypothetical protein HOLDEFILI_03467 [Holdemania filiformis DSM 12042]